MRMAYLVMAGIVLVATHAFAGDDDMKHITLTPKDLYAGFDARYVVPAKDGSALNLDARLFKYHTTHKGWVITDPIALIPAVDGVAPAGAVEGLEVEAAVNAADGATVMLEVRTGPGSMDDKGWSLWEKVQGLKGSVTKVAGRYAQVRLTLTATAEDKLPGVTSVTLRPKVKLAAWKKPAKVTEDKIQTIVRSPIEFHYESPHHPRLAKLRKSAKLDEVIKDAKDDFEALVKLQDWVAQSTNDRHKGWNKAGYYPWDMSAVMELDAAKPEERKIFGHCMSYCEVMVDVCSSLGYKARHMSIMGFREMSHEIPDIWVPSLGKWVFFDPSLANYYMDPETGTPLNSLELHNIIVKTYLNEGETMAWFSYRKPPQNYSQAKARVKQIGGKKPVKAYLGGWMYGKEMPENYDWGWSHGWLAHGFVQMTPRNDFYTHPEKVSKRFGSYPGYDDFPFFVDEMTNPRKKVTNWYTRLRDFYWTLDQASVALVQSGTEGTLTVELGQSMPFFAKYEISIDGKDATPAGAPPASIEWKLNAGKNTLVVTPVDEFGKKGTSSSVVVEY